MGEIIKFPAQASKLGYKPVKRRRRTSESPGQLVLFPAPGQILQFESDLSPFEKALLHDERGDGRAAEFYRQAIDAGDEAADAHCNLGILETKQGNTTKAFDCFTSALKHQPRHSEAHYNLANLYFDLNDFRLAQAHYEMAVQIDESFANAFFNLMLVQAINGDIEGAQETLGRYRSLVTQQEGRFASELLNDLVKSLRASQVGS